MKKPIKITHVLLGGAGLFLTSGFIAANSTGQKRADGMAATDRDIDRKANVQATSDLSTQFTQTEQKKAAIAALADKLNVPSDALNVVSVTSVVWASGGLGCPEFGKQYTQALVPGTLIVLSDKQAQYRFHAMAGGKPFYCPAPRSRAPVNNATER